MEINDTAYRKVARWLNENWEEEVIKADSFSDICKKTNSIFGLKTQPATISTIIYGIAGTRDIYLKD